MKAKQKISKILLTGFIMTGFWGCQKAIVTGPNMPSLLTPTLTETFTSTNTPNAVSSTATFTATFTPTVIITSTMVSTLTATPYPSTTITPQPTISPNGIVFQGIFFYYDHQNNYAQASLDLAVNGLPETTAAVTMITPDGNIPMIFSSAYGPTAEYIGKVHFPYHPGSYYAMTANTSIGTASATMIGPGGNETVTPDGLSASWSVEGNADQVAVAYNGNSSYASPYPGDANSPFSIPPSTYTVHGTYAVWLNLINRTNNVIGASVDSFFETFDSTSFAIYK